MPAIRSRMPRVKICGVKRPEDIRAAVASGADAIGLNFVARSPRFVGNLQSAQALIAAAGTAKLLWCGVFVDATLDEIRAATETLKLDVVQLHGDESPEFAQRVKQLLNVTVWKAVRIATANDIATLPKFACDGWVLDSKVEGLHGGSGKTFDWNLVNGLKRSTQLILSGGLHPTNVADAVRCTSPDWVDVASGVESAPGVKDAALIDAFIREARRS